MNTENQPVNPPENLEQIEVALRFLEAIGQSEILTNHALGQHSDSVDAAIELINSTLNPPAEPISGSNPVIDDADLFDESLSAATVTQPSAFDGPDDDDGFG